MGVLQLLGSAVDGGAESYFIELVGALSRAGVRQAVALRAHAGREAALLALGVPTRVLPFSSPIDLTTRTGVASLARRTGAKALIAWMSRAAARTPRGPWARIGRLGGYYDLKYYRGFDLLVGNTPDIAAWIAGQGWPADKIAWAPNFARAEPAAPISRAVHDTPEGVPLLLAMGRLHAAKAHDVSLRALTRLPDAYLWIAGTGPEAGALMGLAGDLGVADRVRFLGWRSDAAALYRTADLCLFPSRYEPLGNVVLQAWAHGLPIVAAAAKGPASLIREGEDGLLVPVDDPEALAMAARRLLDDPALRARLAGGGLVRIAAEFSEAAVVERWRALLQPFGAA